ncbi:unnamed protein product [Parnassius apollo]|uniref:(apollo) hypothetical protein n=1 Tax=Parnassius apollo TaxID=110799 RepID=A0A8S3Y0W0_PARAO|nr:unnamed protein product [Parnassius apollo]
MIVNQYDAEQTLNIEKSPDTIFISNNDEVGEIQQYVEENSWPLNEVHNRSVEQVINMESVQTIRFVASQHEPANEASNLSMAYTTEKGKLVNAKQLKPGCGDKCRLKCTLKINEQQRLVIFNNFWILGDLNGQRDFVKNAMKEVKLKYSLHNAQSKLKIY